MGRNHSQRNQGSQTTTGYEDVQQLPSRPHRNYLELIALLDNTEADSAPGAQQGYADEGTSANS